MEAKKKKRCLFSDIGNLLPVEVTQPSLDEDDERSVPEPSPLSVSAGKRKAPDE